MVKESSSKKGTPEWSRGVERARAQAVALLKRIGPDAEHLTEEERRKMHRKLAADLQRLVRAIDRHLAEAQTEKAPSRTRPSSRARRR